MAKGEVTMAKEEQIGGFDKWEITSAYSTLIEAKEILNDKKKVAAVRIYAKEVQEAAVKVAAELKLEKTVSKKLAKIHNPCGTDKKKK